MNTQQVLLPALRMDLAEIPLPGEALPRGMGPDRAECSGVAPERTLLTCCVRLSPEKDPQRFVEVVECLAARGILERLQVPCMFLRLWAASSRHITCLRRSQACTRDALLGVKVGCQLAGVLSQVTPLLLGSAQTPYAQELRGRFRAAAPEGRVEERFLGPDSIAGIYAQTRLNFHPCLYDAFGMTVIEAASQGVPLLGP